MKPHTASNVVFVHRLAQVMLQSADSVRDQGRAVCFDLNLGLCGYVAYVFGYILGINSAKKHFIKLIAYICDKNF